MFDRYPEDELPSAKSRHWAGVFFAMVVVAGVGYALQAMPNNRQAFVAKCSAAGGAVYENRNDLIAACIKGNQVLFAQYQ